MPPVFDLRRMLNPQMDEHGIPLDSTYSVSNDGGQTFSAVQLLPPIFKSCAAIDLEIGRIESKLKECNENEMKRSEKTKDSDTETETKNEKKEEKKGEKRVRRKTKRT